MSYLSTDLKKSINRSFQCSANDFQERDRQVASLMDFDMQNESISFSKWKNLRQQSSLEISRLTDEVSLKFICTLAFIHKLNN